MYCLNIKNSQQLKPAVMRKHQLLFALLLFVITSSFLPARNAVKRNTMMNKSSSLVPSEPTWTLLLETDTELEVLYALDNCDDQKKLLLKYFNEVPSAQNIKYRVNLKYAGYVIDEEKVKSVSANQIIAADCSASDTTMFVKLPLQWELDRVTVTASLIEVHQHNN
jgi:hypothetical protein